MANPTFSEANGAGRGKVKAHVSVRHQVGWLYKRAAEAGFALAPRPEDEVSDDERARWSPLENVGVTERWTDTFLRTRTGGDDLSALRRRASQAPSKSPTPKSSGRRSLMASVEPADTGAVS